MPHSTMPTAQNRIEAGDDPSTLPNPYARPSLTGSASKDQAGSSSTSADTGGGFIVDTTAMLRLEGEASSSKTPTTPMPEQPTAAASWSTTTTPHPTRQGFCPPKTTRMRRRPKSQRLTSQTLSPLCNSGSASQPGSRLVRSLRAIALCGHGIRPLVGIRRRLAPGVQA